VIVFSIGFFGVKGAVFSIVSGGQNLVFGPADSFVSDNNALALALNMIIPIAWYLAKEESNKWVRMALLVTFAGSILAVIFTYSRSGFLGLATVMMLLFMKANLGRKVLGAIALSFALIFALILVPQKWYSRMNTIETYDQDRSAMGRIEAWKLAWRIAIDRPFTGGGFGVINHKTLYDKYYAEAGIRTGVHSAYFEVLAESGFVAFSVFISLLFFSLLTLRKIRRRIRRFPDAHWVANICNMLEISIIAYGVCGAFLELASFDLIYHLVAAVMIIRLLAEQHYRQATGLQVGFVPAAARSAERVAQNVPLGVAGKSV
jgi:probable O-glycosylation ligase (exosortase A-associated)